MSIELMRIAGIPIFWDPEKKEVVFTAGMTIDADGSPRAYGPDNTGLDFTANAGHPGNWWAVVTDAAGNPIIQGSGAPRPGMFVSTTTYERRQFPREDPDRYVDSEQVPYVVIPGSLRNKVAPVFIGCFALVTNTSDGMRCEAVVADVGPNDHLGEGSIALANQLGLPGNPRAGGTESKVIEYRIFPGKAAVIGGETFELQHA